MDFVVIGLGLSALALLTGLTLLCLVAPRWFHKAGAAQPGDAAFARAQAGERLALGQGFLCVGAVLLLGTLGGISAGLADKAGAYLIASITTLAVLGLLGWDLLYRRQHPIPQRRRVAKARAKPEAADAAAAPLAAPTSASPAVATTAVRRRVLPARQPVAAGDRLAAAANGSSEDLVDEASALWDERPQAGILEPSSDITGTVATAAVDAEPGPEVPEPAAECGVAGDSPPHLIDEPVSEQAAAGESAGIAAVLPEPVPFAPVKSNGATDPATSPTPGEESELVTHGDDRVIALFPTAAARRGRATVTPTDPDGQS